MLHLFEYVSSRIKLLKKQFIAHKIRFCFVKLQLLHSHRRNIIIENSYGQPENFI